MGRDAETGVPRKLQQSIHSLEYSVNIATYRKKVKWPDSRNEHGDAKIVNASQSNRDETLHWLEKCHTNDLKKIFAILTKLYIRNEVFCCSCVFLKYQVTLHRDLNAMGLGPFYVPGLLEEFRCWWRSCVSLSLLSSFFWLSKTWKQTLAAAFLLWTCKMEGYQFIDRMSKYIAESVDIHIGVTLQTSNQQWLPWTWL